jgi:putative spermidine/putrescine transport system ATP-binding protein
MAGVVVENLTKRFGASAAVDRVSLAVPDGAIVAILGPSGCGKTTFLRLLAGLETPDGGTIRIGAADVTGLPPERRGLGMMFQSYALFPHMTVAENLHFPLKMRRIDHRAAQTRVADALRLVRMEGFADRYPRQLSGGQQQRVALARAIIADPPVLLLDEPLSNLDAQLRKEMQVELIELHRKIGLTTVLVTHDQEEALSLAGLVVLMRAGRIEQIGSPHDIYRNPQTAFAASFIGSANLIPVRVAKGEAVIASGLTVALPGAKDGEGLLVLRQEDLALRAQPLAGEVALAASVLAIAYHGAQCRIVAALGDHRVTLVMPAGAAAAWSVGAAGLLCWEPANASVLPGRVSV